MDGSQQPGSCARVLCSPGQHDRTQHSTSRRTSLTVAFPLASLSPEQMPTLLVSKDWDFDM